jgi:hypothetical protein
MSATAVQARPLHGIAVDALRVNCGHCWSAPGQPCSCDRPGTHLARFARARRRGLISDPDMCAVLDELDAFTPAAVLYGEAAA